MRSKRLQVLVTDDMDHRVRRAADRARVSRGEWVRQAIRERLERDSGPVPADPLAELRTLNGPTADICGMIGEIEAGRS
ncbi:MAG: ribbon-helix-helix protein, CopG family [Gemmatimonadetes bacterium]|nr:ribbon-helix-helix protein, CopG family [Gemmatimonadota bacterium]MYA63036.1 ribbon-helix-helix protein, CopG family [Gemmatimonadota bacterium]MYB98234.1 ribbon-helix-helix protein, CopG family [Gemmatimonadota bacterium]MYH51353.1 ribbon-helix-helix protein, CopG family [Gemmatimonadota bacterium]MYI44859.1 ribbon-helix-helix protein, CopG family [Gemmatimonadota bacterium]